MKNDGKLVFENVEEDFASEMALELDEDIENVRVTLMYLEKNNLIETISDEEYFLPEVLSVTLLVLSGLENTERKRKRYNVTTM